MSDEQALGISDILFKPVLMRLIEGLQQKSVEGVSRNGDVRVLITGNVSVARVAIGSKLTQDVSALEQQVAEATNDAFMKARDVVRVEVKRVLGNIPWIDDLFNLEV
ncbi:MAG: YbaB/EbfC family nucleoid-associated protein [Thermacetogeniaceae bacterium]|jgi:DNA-binding protein YbaB